MTPMDTSDDQQKPSTAQPLLSSTPKPGFVNSTRSSHSADDKSSHDLTITLLLKIWKYDLCLCALSFAAMIALVVLLSTQDGERQQTWADGTITLNTAISILSTVIRSAVVVPIAAALTQQKWLWYRSNGSGKRLWDFEVFERASRGVPGSMHLLGITGLKRFASLGAVAVVASIAIGPFSQLLLTINEKRATVLDPNLNVTVSRAYRYDAYTSHDTHATVVSSDKPTFAMVSAMMSGIFAAHVDDLPTTCPTGDCDWSFVQSLAVCGQCETFTPEWDLHVKKKDLVPTTDHGEYKLVMPADGTPDGKKRRAVFTSDSFPYLTVFQIIELSSINDMRADSTTWSDLHGQECGMWLCAQAYNISVKNGVQTDRVVATTADTYKTDNWEDDSWISPTPNEHFGASARAYWGLNYQLADVFEGSFNRSSNDARNETRTTSPVMSALDAYGAPAVVQNVAKSMTNHIRMQVAQTALDPRLLGKKSNMTVPIVSTKTDWVSAMNGPPPAQSVNTSTPLFVRGTAYSLEPFFHVRWAWIILPALLTLISPVFVGMTIWTSYRTRTPILGSGLRALVACRVDERLRDADEVERSSKSVDVGMERDETGRGWRVVKMGG